MTSALFQEIIIIKVNKEEPSHQEFLFLRVISGDYNFFLTQLGH